MATPATRETLKQYALRALGKPVIEINVDDDQLEDRLDEALQYFAQYHYDGIQRAYLKYQYTEADKTRMTADSSESITKNGVTTSWKEGNNFLVVPESIISVINIFPFSNKSNMNLFDVRYQLRLNDLYDFSSTSIIHFEMTMRHLDYLDHILTGEYIIDFREHQNRLYINADMEKDFNNGDFLLIECYRKLNPDTFTDIYDDMFLKRYATALIKKQWGANLSKFNGVAMLGGVTMNGEQIYTQAIEEVSKLEEQIQLAFELPPMYYKG